MLIAAEGIEKNPQWKGTIEEKDGVKVIKNPNEPLYGEIEFELEEDLSIGNEEDENYLFYKARSLQVDNKGMIYVLESGNSRIQKFDHYGNYVQTIGRQGQGPGEFTMPSNLQIDIETGHIYVNDFMKLEIFDSEGKHLQKIKLTTPFPNILVNEDEESVWLMLPSFNQTDFGQIKYSFCKLNYEGKILNNMGSFSYLFTPTNMARTSKQSGEVSVLITGYEHQLHFTKIDNNTIIHGYSDKYELNLIDNDGNCKFRIQRKTPIQHFTKNEKKKYEGVNLPDYKPFFHHIFTDSKDRIYVQRSLRKLSKKFSRSFDIYSKQGYFLHKASLPYSPHVIKDGYLYTLISFEDTGEEYIKRYKIKNWEQIKTGIN